MTANKKQKSVHEKLLKLVDSFLTDLESLSEMYSSIVPFLQETNKKKRDEFAELFVKKIPDSEKSDSDSDGTIKEMQESNSGQKGTPAQAGDKGVESEQKEIEVSITFSGADAEKLLADIKKSKRAQNIFEKQSIVALVSRFDEFYGSLLHLVLEQNPSWLSSSEKTLTYKELIEIKSIDKAIEGVISKEVETLMFGSHSEQVDYLDSKLKLGIAEHFNNLPSFLEVTERRNLFVHTGGVVSQKYIDKCESYGSPVDKVSKGNLLEADTEYFKKAFIVFFEAGLRIGQAAFRRLFPTHLEHADKELNELAIKFMRSGDYVLAELITEFDINISEKLRSQDCEYPYFARINRAATQKFQGKSFEDGLKSIPWNVFHPKYSLCLHVLREDYDSAITLMKTAEIQSSVGEKGFRNWPVFKEFRETEIFQDTYYDIYKKDYEPELNFDFKIEVDGGKILIESDKNEDS